MSQDLVRQIVQDVLTRNQPPHSKSIPSRGSDRNQTSITNSEDVVSTVANQLTLNRPNYQREKSLARTQKFVKGLPYNQRGDTNPSDKKDSNVSSKPVRLQPIGGQPPEPSLSSSLMKAAMHHQVSRPSSDTVPMSNKEMLGEVIGKVDNGIGVWWFPNTPKSWMLLPALSTLAQDGPFGVITLKQPKPSDLMTIESCVRDATSIVVTLNRMDLDGSVWVSLMGGASGQLKSILKQIFVRLNRKQHHLIDMYYSRNPSQYILNFIKVKSEGVSPFAVGVIEGLDSFDSVLLMDCHMKRGAEMKLNFEIRTGYLLCTGEAGTVQSELKSLKQLADELLGWSVRRTT